MGLKLWWAGTVPPTVWISRLLHLPGVGGVELHSLGEDVDGIVDLKFLGHTVDVDDLALLEPAKGDPIAGMGHEGVLQVRGGHAGNGGLAGHSHAHGDGIGGDCAVADNAQLAGLGVVVGLAKAERVPVPGQEQGVESGVGGGGVQNLGRLEHHAGGQIALLAPGQAVVDVPLEMQPGAGMGRLVEPHQGTDVIHLTVIGLIDADISAIGPVVQYVQGVGSVLAHDSSS